MARQNSWFLSAMLRCVLIAFFFAGCTDKKGNGTPQTGGGQTEKHAHDHEKPETLVAGVGLLKEHYEEIKTAFEADDEDKAHDPLHCVGDILEALPDLATSAELTEDQVKSVQDASDKMFEAYGQIDSAIHAGEKADYAAVASTLDENMAALEKIVSKE